MQVPLQSIHVLHIDDNPHLGDMTASFLERDSAFTVGTAERPSTALEYLSENEVDCVVSDYDMPGMNGLEFLEAVRAEYPDLPFILFTGQGNEEIASEAISAGVTDYLQKQTGTEQYELLSNRITNAVQQYKITHHAMNLDRIFRVLCEVNQAIIEADSRSEIERHVCEVLSDSDPYRLAWIGENDPETQHIEPRTRAGVEDGYLDGIEIPTNGSAASGPTATAHRTRDIAVMSNIPEDTAYNTWQEDALERGYRSSAAVPIEHEGTLYGILNVYADRTHAFDEQEQTLLTKLGDTVAHAIHQIDVEKQLNQYKRIIEHLPIGVYRAGLDGTIFDANEGITELFNANSIDEVCNHNVENFFSNPAALDSVRRRLHRDGVVQNETLRFEAADGEEGWASVTAFRTEEHGDPFVYGIVQDRTEQTNQEQRLRRFRSAVEHAGHAVLICDTDGTIEYVNDAFESTTGYTAAEVSGQTPSILQSGEHDQKFYQDLWETILSDEVWQGEVINERKDGEQYVVDQTIAPITDEEGSLTGFVACNRDISDRKQREQNLTFLKRAIDQAGIGIATINDDGYTTYVNRYLAELLGTDRASLGEHHTTAYIPELNREQFEEYWLSLDEGERQISNTQISRLDADKEIPVEIIGSKTIIGDNSYLVSTVRDISDRKERNRELKRFRSAVENAGHGVLITDSDGTIEYVNEAFEEMSGYSAPEVVGQTPILLKSGEHSEDFYQDLWETILSGEIWHGEVINERKDGKHYVIDQTIAPLTNGDGENTGFVAINRDISDIKEYEQNLEAQNERLKQYGQTVAHDLRNPLTLLNAEIERLENATETACGDLNPESIQERCDSIDCIVRRMEDLIDDLLTMAEQGQLVLEPAEEDLNSVATDAWRQIDAPNAKLSVESMPIQADADRLMQMLSNLFRNAIEHGGDDVHVRVGPLGFGSGFYVEDDGSGIPPEKRDQVFSRGYTTDETGTGFGLAIVEQIANAHGWSVSVTSGADGGARFEIRTTAGST